MSAAEVSPAVAPPPGNPRFALADSIRGIAVAMVLVGHAVAFTGAWTEAWWGDAAIELSVGVLVFFVLSGFLLYRPFVVARVERAEFPGVRAYARRRVLRIVPAYWLALTVLGLTVGLQGLWGDWWVFYGFAQIYSPETAVEGIPQAWSLCVEVRCYLLLPFWALLARRLTVGGSWVRGELWGIAGLIGAFELVRAFEHASPAAFEQVPLIGMPLFHSAFAIGMGMAVASVAIDRGELSAPSAAAVLAAVTRRPGIAWAAAGALFVLISFVIGGAGATLAGAADVDWAEWLGNWWASLLCATLIVVPAVFGDRAGGAVRRMLAWRWLAWIGLISYGIYLWHLNLAAEIAGGLDWLPQPFGAEVTMIALTAVASIAVAAASYYGVELWFLRRKERRPRERLAAEATAGASAGSGP